MYHGTNDSTPPKELNKFKDIQRALIVNPISINIYNNTTDVKSNKQIETYDFQTAKQANRHMRFSNH